MHINRLFVLLVTVLVIVVLVAPVAAQENPGCANGMGVAVVNKPPQGADVWAFRDVQMNVVEGEDLHEGDTLCVGPVNPANNSYRIAFRNNKAGFVAVEAVNLQIPPQETAQASPEATMVPAQQAPAQSTQFADVRTPDLSWFRAEAQFHQLGGSATVRNAPDQASRQIGSINMTTDPVVQVLAEYEGRLLVRSQNVTGWVNNDNAKINLAQAVSAPEWSIPATVGKDPQGTCLQFGLDEANFYSPNGDQLSDLWRVGGNLVGHGTFTKNDETHGVYALRIAGVYNPRMVKHMIWQRAQGDGFSCEPGTPQLATNDPAYEAPWLIVENLDAFPGTEKASIGLELLIKDAYIHSQLKKEDGSPFRPPYVFGDIAGNFVLMTQETVLGLPQATINVAFASVENGQGGGGVVINPLDQANCPVSAEPQRVEVNGLLVEGLTYAAAIGTVESSCWNVALYIDNSTPAGEIFIEAWRGQNQGFTYTRDQIWVVQFPENMTPEAINQFTMRSMSEVRRALGWNNRNTLVVRGDVPGFQRDARIQIAQ